MEIGYWKIHGLGAPLRMMCAYKEEEVTHFAANSREMWFENKKPSLLPKNSLINLPFIVDGEEVITQSNSCLVYLGHRLKIDDPKNAIRNHQALDQIMDLRNDLMRIAYPFFGVTPEKFLEALKTHNEGNATNHFTKLEAFVKGPYISGNAPESADFHLFEMIDQHIIMCESNNLENVVAKFPKLIALHAAMKGEKTLASYFESDMYKKWPVNNPMAANWKGPLGDAHDF